MPDFERKSRASFISSKEGETPSFLHAAMDKHEQIILLALSIGCPLFLVALFSQLFFYALF